MNRSNLIDRIKKEKKPAEEKKLQFISFLIGEEEYATDILKVFEITNLKKLTKVPSMPHFVKGVLNLKGLVVPVIDLREKFGADSTKVTKYSVIMVVDVSGRVMGVIVDRVNEILKIKSSEIQPPPRFFSGIKSQFIRGMVKKDSDSFMIILDMAKILSDQELDIMDNI